MRSATSSINLLLLACLVAGACSDQSPATLMVRQAPTASGDGQTQLVDAYLHEQPEAAPFLCHRVYDLHKLHESDASTPQTPLGHGLRSHVASLLDQT